MVFSVGNAIHAIVGLFVLHAIIGVLKFFYRLFYPFFIGKPIDLWNSAGGSWAVVTGSTDGIGKEYARQLASRGFSILLVARNEKKLEATRKELRKDFKVEIRTHKLDFSEASLGDYENLKELLDSLDIGILVNNVGVGFEYPADIQEQSLKQLFAISQVNVQPATLLTASVLGQMRARQAGIVIDISSAAAIYPLKMWNAYSASKKYSQNCFHVLRRYVEWLSEIVRRENASTGIIVQTVTPSIVSTNMTRNTKPSFTEPSAQTFVQSAIRSIGLVESTTGYFGHQLQVELYQLMPTFVLLPLADRMTQNVHDMLANNGPKKNE